MHGILQALCRGAVRQCNGSMCFPCNAYIIASQRSGIAELLPTIFPGCKVKEWKPVKRKLKGKVGAGVELLRGLFADPETELVKIRDVAAALGMSGNNFRKYVRKHPAFIEELAELDLIEWGKDTYYTAFKRVTAADYGF